MGVPSAGPPEGSEAFEPQRHRGTEKKRESSRAEEGRRKRMIQIEADPRTRTLRLRLSFNAAFYLASVFSLSLFFSVPLCLCGSNSSLSAFAVEVLLQLARIEFNPRASLR